MRALVYATLMLIVSLPAFAVDNFNLPGSDYANYGGGSALLCRHTCAADARCEAWTWVKSSAHCWLKFRVPPLVRDLCWLKTGGPFPAGDNNVVSGVKYMPRGAVD